MRRRLEVELNSTSITIEIQREMAEAVRLRKADRNDPRIKTLMVRIDELAQRRRSLLGA